MANNYLAVTNTVDGHSKFKKGVRWYYPLNSDNYTSATAAFDAFKADSVRESKVSLELPVLADKIWRVKIIAIDNTASRWAKRYAGANGQDGQISDYLDAEAGQILQSVVVHNNGRTYTAPFNYDANGYKNPDLFSDTRPGGLPKYAALHNSIPDGSAQLQVRNSLGQVLRDEQVTVSATLPSGPLLALAIAPKPTTPTATTGSGPLMNIIRVRYRASARQVDIEFNGSGDWRYKVARPQAIGASQAIPDFDAISWVDAPTGTGTQTITLADHPNQTLQVILGSKKQTWENYELPIKCLPGDTNGFDWLTFIEPGASLLDTSKPVILPGRTWTENLRVTVEAGPNADTVTVRMKSGFDRDPNTRWFWTVCGIPLFDLADQDNVTVVVAKGIYVEVNRHVCPINYTSEFGEFITVRQLTSLYYVGQAVKYIDRVTIKIPA